MYWVNSTYLHYYVGVCPLWKWNIFQIWRDDINAAIRRPRIIQRQTDNEWSDNELPYIQQTPTKEELSILDLELFIRKVLTLKKPSAEVIVVVVSSNSELIIILVYLEYCQHKYHYWNYLLRGHFQLPHIIGINRCIPAFVHYFKLISCNLQTFVINDKYMAIKRFTCHNISSFNK